MRPAILIAPAESIAALKGQPYLREAQAFADTDSSRAMEAVREQKPGIIALERAFAESPPGQAMIRQIRSEPGLASCAIKTVNLRRVPRHTLAEKVEILVDGTPATLFDISAVGARVISTSPLRPRQRIRVALREGEQALIATVMWAAFEMPKEGPRYRAGIEFADSASEAVVRLVAALASR